MEKVEFVVYDEVDEVLRCEDADERARGVAREQKWISKRNGYLRRMENGKCREGATLRIIV